MEEGCIERLVKLAISDQIISDTAMGAYEGMHRFGGAAGLAAGVGTYLAASPQNISKATGGLVGGGIGKARTPLALLAAAIAYYLGARKVGLPLGALQGAAYSGRTPPMMPTRGRLDPLDTSRSREKNQALLNVLAGQVKR